MPHFYDTTWVKKNLLLSVLYELQQLQGCLEMILEESIFLLDMYNKKE